MKKEDLINKAIVGAELYTEYELCNGDILTAELFPTEDGNYSFIYEYSIFDEDGYIIFTCWEPQKEKLVDFLKSYF